MPRETDSPSTHKEYEQVRAHASWAGVEQGYTCAFWDGEALSDR
jgi:hypothetical protein